MVDRGVDWGPARWKSEPGLEPQWHELRNQARVAPVGRDEQGDQAFVAKQLSCGALTARGRLHAARQDPCGESKVSSDQSWFLGMCLPTPPWGCCWLEMKSNPNSKPEQPISDMEQMQDFGGFEVEASKGARN